jgi:hypothetical protein
MIKLKNLIFENTIPSVRKLLPNAMGNMIKYYYELTGMKEPVYDENYKSKIDKIIRNIPPLFLSKIEEVKDEIVKNILKFNNKKCYRIMTIKPGVNPSILKKVGVHWCVDKDVILNWEPYRDSQGAFCLFTGIVDRNHINWPLTIDNRFFYVLGNEGDITGGDEKEIVFLKNSPIYIKNVEYWEGNHQSDNYDDVKIIPINSNRQT